MNGRTPVLEIVHIQRQKSQGGALIVSPGGNKCPTTSEPQYISEEDYTAPSTGQRAIRCFLVESNQLWEAPVDFSASPVELVLGTKLEIDASGLGVTDVTTTGVATLFDVLDADDDDGDKVIVRFE